MQSLLGRKALFPLVVFGFGQIYSQLQQKTQVLPPSRQSKKSDMSGSASRLTAYSKAFNLALDQNILDLVDDILVHLRKCDPDVAKKLEDELIASIISKNFQQVAAIGLVIRDTCLQYAELKSKDKYLNDLNDALAVQNLDVACLWQLYNLDLSWLSTLVRGRERDYSEEKACGVNNTLMGGLTTGAAIVNPFVGGIMLTYSWGARWFQGKDAKQSIRAREEQRKAYLKAREELENKRKSKGGKK